MLAQLHRHVGSKGKALFVFLLTMDGDLFSLESTPACQVVMQTFTPCPGKLPLKWWVWYSTLPPSIPPLGPTPPSPFVAQPPWNAAHYEKWGWGWMAGPGKEWVQSSFISQGKCPLGVCRGRERM